MLADDDVLRLVHRIDVEGAGGDSDEAVHVGGEDVILIGVELEAIEADFANDLV